MNFRARYEYGNRTGSGLDEASLVQIGEQPQMRHYDLADRTRNRFVGQMDLVPNEALTLSVSGGVGSDEFNDSYFGLQDAGFRNLTISADYMTQQGYGVGASYDYEHYSGTQQSRSASPGQTPPQETDPNRDWITDSKERVQYFSIYVNSPRIGGKTEARLAYEYAYARGNFVYEVGPALPPPSQLPETFNKLQDLRLDIRHRINQRLVATLSYVYEPSKIFDFAMDPECHQRHRAAELAHPRLYVPSLHGEHVRIRHSVFLVRLLAQRGRQMQRVSITGGLFMAAVTAMLVVGTPRVARSQDAEVVKKGRAGVRRPEMLGVPRHRRQGRQVEPARRGWRKALG